MSQTNAVAKQDQPSRAAVARANLPASIQAKIEERRAYNVVSAQIRGTAWGKELGEQGVRAVVEYGRRHGIDPVAELEVLGGRIYKNVYYYRRKGAELMAAGLVKSVLTDHVEADTRLDEIIATAATYATQAADANDAEDADYWRAEGRKARREIVRRKNERVRVGANEKAAAVVVVRIATPWLVAPIEGWNQAGGNIRSGDPVGNAEASKTAESRALRRAWLNLVEAGSKIEAAEPVRAFVHQELRSEADAEIAEIEIAHDAAQITAGHEAARPKMLAGTGTDVYGTTETPDGELFPVETVAPRTQMDEAV